MRNAKQTTYFFLLCRCIGVEQNFSFVTPDFLAKNPSISSIESKEGVKWCDVVVFAVKGTIALSLIKDHAAELVGKVVLDATNPIADAGACGSEGVYLFA